MKRFIQQKAAFTLAEVLITLGIIGVVAAITMPTLIQNYKKTVYVNQLKKSVSTLEQGFQKILADEGVDLLQQSSVFTSLDNSFVYSTPDSLLLKNLQKYFKFVDLKSVTRTDIKGLSGQAYNGSPMGYFPPMVKLSDGTMISFYLSKESNLGTPCSVLISQNVTDKCESLIGNIGIDLNSIKGPNQYGRDIFWFMLSERGKIIPFGSYKSLEPMRMQHTSWIEDTSLCAESDKPIGENISGFGCAARIIENGWKMDY